MFGNKVGHLGRVGSLTLAQRVSAMFSRGEPGAWYDTSDMSTLFQDAAGTTPVTAVEQPVGRMLDKSGRGNHASQATTTKRPKYSRRYQITINEGQFLPLWTYTCTTTNVGSPPGIANNTLITPTALPSVPIVGAVAKGTSITFTAYFKQVAPINLAVLVRNDTTSTNLGSAEVISSAGTPNVNAVSVGDGWYKYTITQSSGIQPGDYLVFYLGRNTGTPEGQSWRVAGVSIVETTDAHLPYQWVNTDTDYDADPNKFPAYLRFDGVDDALQTGNIDFTSTDKMTVWAGITKLSDAGSGVVASCGLLDSGGGFFISAPSSPAAVYGARSRGTVLSALTEVGGYPAPHSAVLCGVFDVAGRKADLRVGGVTTTNGTDQGVGNFSLRPLAIGANPGGSLYFFNGRIYGLIVRGAQTPLSRIEATELYIKQKMRMP